MAADNGNLRSGQCCGDGDGDVHAQLRQFSKDNSNTAVCVCVEATVASVRC